MNANIGTTSFEGAELATTFKEADGPLPAPKARKPDGPLLSNPPHKGYWECPQSGTRFSGGMEIGPPERSF